MKMGLSDLWESYNMGGYSINVAMSFQTWKVAIHSK